MGNLSDLLKNPTSQVDTVAALVEAVLLDEQASDSNLASNLAGGGVGSVPIQSGPNATIFVASPTTSGHKFLLAWQPSGAAVEPAVIDATSLGTLAAASSSNPIVDGTAAPGTAVTYARGDHVHPTDTSRAVAGANSDITSLGAVNTIKPGTIYSAAGTPLPTPSSALKGAQAIVSDAVTPAYMVAYTGGALGVLCAVICDGTTWFTH